MKVLAHLAAVTAIAPRLSEDWTTPTLTGTCVVLHGHFYQPPRENPWLETIEPQPSAAPFHDWNERIYWECYRPNAFARLVDSEGQILEIVNNFAYLSFNIGPTLMGWLERYDPEVYRRIQQGDRLSRQRLGFGNAIAQNYNHIILPLANEQDKITQIHWGIEDFRRHFGRAPEGMWLAETAVDSATLMALVDAGIRFTILAPTQAARCRPIPRPDLPRPGWQDVSDSSIDPTQPYRCYLPEGRWIDLFFYDGPISRDLSFGGLLHNAEQLGDRLTDLLRVGETQVLCVAADGETFGHHKPGAEKGLAYAFRRTFPARGWQMTNFAHYLHHHPPTWEVELKPTTAWSCAHGVDRWQRDCGCGREGNTQQQWRQPLRQSLNALRDELAQIFERWGSPLLKDVWQARNDYIQLLGEPPLPGSLHEAAGAGRIAHFLEQHQRRPLQPLEQIDALRLLEMQRQSLLMFTSCGWFFEELSRPEGVQIQRYAARAMELATAVSGRQLEAAFLDQLSTAPTNVALFSDGASVYDRLVRPGQVSLSHVAAFAAMRQGLSRHLYPESSRSTAVPSQIYACTLHWSETRWRRIGNLSVLLGQIGVIWNRTQEGQTFNYVVAYLGQNDIQAWLLPSGHTAEWQATQHRLLEESLGGAPTRVILEISRCLPAAELIGLADLLPEERQILLRQLSQATLERLNDLYAQIYRDNTALLSAFHDHGWTAPRELQAAAEITLAQRLTTLLSRLESLEGGDRPTLIDELNALAAEAEALHCRLNTTEARDRLERLQRRTLQRWLAPEPDIEPEHRPCLEDLMLLIRLGRQLELHPRPDRLQEWLLAHPETVASLSEGDRQRLLQALGLTGQSLESTVN
jgi:alpha-amylase/alpha-mannosidase (GH57 family)